MKRRCADCQGWTRTVCRHAFGRFWEAKSRGGEGCDFPLDDVAGSWRVAGWKPEDGTTKSIALPLPPMPPSPPSTASLTQLRMPRRAKVSAETRRSAELFFGGRR